MPWAVGRTNCCLLTTWPSREPFASGTYASAYRPTAAEVGREAVCISVELQLWVRADVGLNPASAPQQPAPQRNLKNVKNSRLLDWCYHTFLHFIVNDLLCFPGAKLGPGRWR